MDNKKITFKKLDSIGEDNEITSGPLHSNTPKILMEEFNKVGGEQITTGMISGIGDNSIVVANPKNNNFGLDLYLINGNYNQKELSNALMQKFGTEGFGNIMLFSIPEGTKSVVNNISFDIGETLECDKI